MSQESLVQLIEQQIKIEENFVTMIDEQIKQMQNVAARLLLLETQKDSEKHAIILKGILEVINKKEVTFSLVTLLLWYICIREV